MDSEIDKIEYDITEILARALLYKNQRAEGCENPNTDNWLSHYNGTVGYSRSNKSGIDYSCCMFRAEVRHLVSSVMHCVQKHTRTLEPVCMSFGKVLEAAKEGHAVTRIGWPSGMYIYYVHADRYPPKNKTVKRLFGDTVPYAAYLALNPGKGDIVPWTATQTDLLSEDWKLV